MIAASGRTPTTVDPAASARDAAAEVLSSVRGETLRQYIEECDRLRAEVDRWRSVAWLVAIRVGDSPDEAERSLRSIVHHQDVGGRSAADHLRAADLIRDAHSECTARRRAELYELRMAQSAGRST